MPNPCVFCDDPSKAGDVVFENEVASVVLHDDWSVRGHAMVASRRHVENASQLTAEEWAAMTALWHRVEEVLLRATGADRAVIMKLGLATPHLHVHIYPVSAEATRTEVFDAIDGRTRNPRDEALVGQVRAAFQSSPS